MHCQTTIERLVQHNTSPAKRHVAYYTGRLATSVIWEFVYFRFGSEVLVGDQIDPLFVTVPSAFAIPAITRFSVRQFKKR